jgi:FKBP-type peptidyl-prolyl cis-trans isomerase FklB
MRFGTWLYAAACAVLIAGAAGAAEMTELKADKDKNGYSIGYDIGRTLKKQPVEIDADAVVQGFRDAFTGGKALMTDQEVQDRLTAMQKEIVQKVPEINTKQGEEFLAKNKKEKGVKTLASGLQYKVVTDGKGKKPKADDTVSVNYRGSLIDGTEFDSSYKRNQPATFPVKGVIPGWTEALQLMKEGSKWMLYVPSNLAYGERGAGRMIGPNSALIFEVELIKIEDVKDQPKTPAGHPDIKMEEPKK